jgi:hypothetical protein
MQRTGRLMTLREHCDREGCEKFTPPKAMPFVLEVAAAVGLAVPAAELRLCSIECLEHEVQRVRAQVDERRAWWAEHNKEFAERQAQNVAFDQGGSLPPGLTTAHNGTDGVLDVNRAG